ncbi:hypothetical protein ABT112_19795 [Streptomyces sp. NPDC002055]|uniref:hypothetical protein n=1 Tax=Streptomyces sp. NPDC002055 TaxID=3154534 RepID=UPI003316814B
MKRRPPAAEAGLPPPRSEDAAGTSGTGSTWAGARHAAELHDGLQGLREELLLWTEYTRPGGPLQRNHSQFARIAATLSGAISATQERITVPPPADLPAEVLDLHHIWDYFRSKLLLRHIASHATFLTVADELAWSGYRAALTAAGGAEVPKEPPLVCLHRDASPRAHRKGSQYRDLLPRGGLHTVPGSHLVRHLPFPVVQLPWSHRNHLPGLLFVAHEVGHHIQDDLLRAETLPSRLRHSTPDASRAALWNDWADEAFADICACLMAGPAYAAVLADSLAVPSGGSGSGADRYPPPLLRLRLCLAALRVAGHGPRESVTAAVAEFLAGREDEDAEAQAVAEALLCDPYEELGGRRLADVLLLTRPGEGESAAGRLLAGRESGTAGAPAPALAGAAVAFGRDPGGYAGRRVHQRVLDEVAAAVPEGIRNRPGARGAPDDAALGRMLLDAARATREPAGAAAD